MKNTYREITRSFYYYYIKPYILPFIGMVIMYRLMTLPNGHYKYEGDLVLGQYYKLSFKYNEKNPFEKKEIEVVKVVGLKDGYVQWQYKDSLKQSCEIDLFKRLIK